MIAKSVEVRNKLKEPVGVVHLEIRDKKGKLVERKRLGKHNLVVDNYGNQIVYPIGGENLVTAKITKIGLGEGITENAARTALDYPAPGAPVTTLITSISYGSASVTFTGTFGTGDANGKTFSEVGLLFAGTTPDLAAIKVFGGTMAKTSAFSWTFVWTLSWT